jgi:hypothetical protein
MNDINGLIQTTALTQTVDERLHKLAAERAARLDGNRPVRRAWLSQQTGRVLRGFGMQLVTLGKRMECGCDPSALMPREAKVAYEA